MVPNRTLRVESQVPRWSSSLSLFSIVTLRYGELLVLFMHVVVSVINALAVIYPVCHLIKALWEVLFYPSIVNLSEKFSISCNLNIVYPKCKRYQIKCLALSLGAFIQFLLWTKLQGNNSTLLAHIWYWNTTM